MCVGGWEVRKGVGVGGARVGVGGASWAAAPAPCPCLIAAARVHHAGVQRLPRPKAHPFPASAGR